jgi:pimeloyl-ACP methyl ester carboxylesterase
MLEKTLNVAGYKCRAIINQVVGIPVVFFHGYSYNSSIWQRIGALDLLVEKGVPFLALDMPYGLKSECMPKTQDPQANLKFAYAAIENIFGTTLPVLIGASLGGYIALRYAAQFPVKGLLLSAPARAFEEDTLSHTYEKFNFPVRIIWGTEDNVISGEEMRTLSEVLPNAKLITYEAAGHSGYTTQPERFKRDLLELYAAAELT